MIRRLAFAAMAAAACAGLAMAQDSPTETTAIAQAKQEAAQATRRSEALEKQAAAATDRAVQARATVAALAARIEAAEADITAAEGRVRIIEARRAEQRARLAERQAPLIHLTAALQTMSRHPPALAFVQPGTVSDVVHVRSLLASTMPLIRARTSGLRGEIADDTRLREEARLALRSLAAGQQELKKQRTALALLEARQLQRSGELAQSALRESDRALAFTEEARDLGEQYGSRQAETETRQRLMELPLPLVRPLADGTPARRAAPGYRLPVQGQLVSGMGEISDAGVHARGLTFETRANAPVIAPANGRIVYAGRFRGYGGVIIIDHGGGWTTTITNLGAISVNRGDAVPIGADLGRTGGSNVNVELRRQGQPFPIAILIQG